MYLCPNKRSCTADIFLSMRNRAPATDRSRWDLDGQIEGGGGVKAMVRVASL